MVEQRVVECITMKLGGGKMQLIMLLKKNYCKWKQWKLGGSKEEYRLGKKPSSCTLYDVKQQAQSDYFQCINTDNDRKKTSGN